MRIYSTGCGEDKSSVQTCPNVSTKTLHTSLGPPLTITKTELGEYKINVARTAYSEVMKFLVHQIECEPRMASFEFREFNQRIFFLANMQQVFQLQSLDPTSTVIV